MSVPSAKPEPHALKASGIPLCRISKNEREFASRYSHESFQLIENRSVINQHPNAPRFFGLRHTRTCPAPRAIEKSNRGRVPESHWPPAAGGRMSPAPRNCVEILLDGITQKTSGFGCRIMQQPNYRERITRLQEAMKEFGFEAIVLEPGPAMLYLTGVRWGKSERTLRSCCRPGASRSGSCLALRRCAPAS